MKFKIGSASQMIKQLIYGWLQSNKMGRLCARWWMD